MKEIKDFNITKLRNDEDFGFHHRVYALATTYVTLETDAAMLASYVTPYKAYDEAMKQSNTNSYTAQVAELDAKADAAWRYARAYVRAMVMCPDGDLAEIASQISAVFDKYGDFTNLGYTQEYGMYHNLIQDLLLIPQDDRNLCSFQIWLDSMMDASEKFNIARESQTGEESKRIAGLIKECRTATDTAYRNFCKYINVMVMVNGEDAYADFIDQLNVIVAEMAANMAARTTKAANAKKEDATEEGTVTEE